MKVLLVYPEFPDTFWSFKHALKFVHKKAGAPPLGLLTTVGLPTVDIAAELGKIKKKSQLLVGFALETDNELENAVSKLKRKKFDLIVLNSLKDKGAGFGSDTNRITIIDKNNIIDKFELKSKEEAAADILDKVVSMLA